MPDPTARQPDNVSGQFYVDKGCVDCDLCRQTAPANFRRNETAGYSYVARQPETDKEREECALAMQDCPVEAIGDNGIEVSIA